MKTSEFKKQIEDMDLTIEFSGIEVKICKRKDLVALISAECPYVTSMSQHYLARLDEETRKILFDLIIEYAKTPIEKREGKKKYRVRLNKKWADYFIFNPSNADWSIDYRNFVPREGWQAEFTQSEIDEFKQRDDIPLDWSKVKLEEVDDENV